MPGDETTVDNQGPMEHPAYMILSSAGKRRITILRTRMPAGFLIEENEIRL
jgi:hypothetical protein